MEEFIETFFSLKNKGLWPATYAIEDVIPPQKGSSALDHNHTHFLLVDNGTEGVYGTEIKFRSRIESFISSKGSTGVSENQGNILLHQDSSMFMFCFFNKKNYFFCRSFCRRT